MRLHDGDKAGARQAWERSRAIQRTPWALRNLAKLAHQEGRLEEGASLLLEAQSLRPDLIPLLVETARALIAAGRTDDFLRLLSGLSDSARQHGRVRLLEVEAGLAADDLERVRQRFSEGFEIVDYREGDEILTDLWFRYHAERLSREEQVPVDETLLRRVTREYPLPPAFDFRMKSEE
jgi:hypothetical protein